MYIALEGIDTVGKSTQIEYLKKLIPNAIFTKEPSDSKIGNKIRDIILNNDLDAKSEFFLFLADRSEHIQNIIKPCINKTIISDRSVISGMSYAKNISKNDIIHFNKIATDGFLPDKAILLIIEKDELEKRLASKQNDKIEKRGVEYLLEIQNKIIEFCKILKIDTIEINANMPREIIQTKIKEFINV